MNARDGDVYPVSRGLTNWLQYTRSGLQAAAGLCTVYTSSARIFGGAKAEMGRIRNELETVCGLIVGKEEVRTKEVWVGVRVRNRGEVSSRDVTYKHIGVGRRYVVNASCQLVASLLAEDSTTVF